MNIEFTGEKEIIIFPKKKKVVKIWPFSQWDFFCSGKKKLEDEGILVISPKIIERDEEKGYLITEEPQVESISEDLLLSFFENHPQVIEGFKKAQVADIHVENWGFLNGEIIIFDFSPKDIDVTDEVESQLKEIENRHQKGANEKKKKKTVSVSSIKDFTNFLSSIEKKILDFDSMISSKNGEQVTFRFAKKIVYEGSDNFIYKIVPLGEGIRQWLIYCYFADQGEEIFNKVELIGFSKTLQVAILREPKVSTIFWIEKDEVIAHASKAKDFLSTGIIDHYNYRNCGKDEQGNIKIFDYVSILDGSIEDGAAVLRNKTGKVIFRKELIDEGI